MTGYPVLLALILVPSIAAFSQVAPPNSQLPAAVVNRSATQPDPVPLDVSVEDRSGAKVPGAWIRIDPKDSGHFSEIQADRTGEAIVPLQPGTYTVSVIAMGFKKWSKGVTIEPGKKQRINPQLDIGDVGWGPVIEEEKTIPLERSLPLAEIKYLLLETAALPSHKLRQQYPRRAIL